MASIIILGLMAQKHGIHTMYWRKNIQRKIEMRIFKYLLIFINCRDCYIL